MCLKSWRKKKHENKRKAWINRNLNSSLGFLNERALHHIHMCVLLCCLLLLSSFERWREEKHRKPTKAFIILKKMSIFLILLAAFCFTCLVRRGKTCAYCRSEEKRPWIRSWVLNMPHRHTVILLIFNNFRCKQSYRNVYVFFSLFTMSRKQILTIFISSQEFRWSTWASGVVCFFKYFIIFSFFKSM